MKSKLLYTFITAILLVPLYGVQAMAQDYKLPNNSGTVTMSEILRENPELKGTKIYGDLKRDNKGEALTPISFYGGTDSNGNLLLQDRYGNDNPELKITRDNVSGLTFTSMQNVSIKSLIVYLADPSNGWSKGEKISFKSQEPKEERKETSVDIDLQAKVDSLTNVLDEYKSVVDNESVFDSKYAWLIYGVLGSLALFILFFNMKVKRNDPSINAGNQSSTPQPNLPKTSSGLSKKDIEQIVEQIEQIIKKNNSEIIDEFGKKIEAKFVSLKNEIFGQDKMPSKVPVRPRTVQIDKKVIKSDAEEFCGYAQLPQNGDFALTITQDPARTAFVISKRGSNYLVGLIDDEQTLSQLVQPLSDLKANGSNIVDFPEGELQGAQKIVCVDRGIFKEESTGRIIPVKPIQIKRG